MVDQWSAHVGKQNRHHDALGKQWVGDANEYGQHPDQGPVEPATAVGLAGGDRISGHEDGAKDKTSQYEVPMPWHRPQWVLCMANEVENEGGNNHPKQAALT